MLGTMLHGANDIRFEECPDPIIMKPTDAILRIVATCVCGSDLWRYRGVTTSNNPVPMGHEYCGIVEEVGRDVMHVKKDQFVIGSFVASDNTCPHCHNGYQSACQKTEIINGAQSQFLRVPLADGTLVGLSGIPSDNQLPGLLATSDVLGTGWFGAIAANVKPGAIVVVVGDGAVGLMAILSARQMGAARIVAMSGHAKRQALALHFGATDLVSERGDEGIARIKEITGGMGADSVIECVGTQESMQQAIRCVRPGGYIGNVGLPHGVKLDGRELFFTHIHIHGGLAPVRDYLPSLIKLVLSGDIDPAPVFDLSLPLSAVADGYRAMDERRAVKALLLP